MNQLHFLLHLSQKFKEILNAVEYPGVFAGNDDVRFLSIFLGQETRFLPGFTSCSQHAQQAETRECVGLMGWVEGKLGWWCACVRGRELQLGLNAQGFHLEPVADRYRQKQKNKEDGQGQIDLVKTVADARGDGNRQRQHQNDHKRDH
jgi:hypothetical protein